MEYGLVVRWLAAYLLLLLVGFPVASALLGRVADRGASVALPLALGVVGVVAFWVGHVSLTAGLVVGVALLVGASALALRRGHTVDRRAYAETAVVFAVAFLVLVAIRAVDPAVHPGGGEKFLDFGLLNSLLRADALPPEDMWFAGEPVQYYYGGHLLAALLSRLTATPPAFAYNLALAGFYAMLVTAAYGLAGNLAAALGAARRRAAVFGGFVAGFASNLAVPVQVVLWLAPAGAASLVAGTAVSDLAGWTPAQFSYWSASRVLTVGGSDVGIPTEFPLFAWLNGDMHAHMMSTPFLLLAATVCLAYYRTPGSERGRRRALLGALVPLAGLLAVVNTWSFPTVGGLVLLTLTFAPADPRTLLPDDLAGRIPHAESAIGQEGSRVVLGLVGAAVVLALGVLASLPFWLGTASGRSIGLLPVRSALGPFLLVHGGFLLVFVPYLGRRLWPHLRDRPWLLVAGALAVVLAAAVDLAAVAVLGPLLVGGWALLRVSRADGRTDSGREGTPATRSALGDGGRPGDVGFETVLLLAGVGLALVVEFAYVKEEAGFERFNTVFKTYMQVWVLWAPVAGAALGRLLDVELPTPRPDTWHRVATVLAVVLVVSTSLYGVFALSAHFSAGRPGVQDPTLDATQFVERYHGDEAAAIDWLDDRPGQPNIVTMPGCWCNPGNDLDPYRWVNAPSSLTGVPTVAGWSHEVGYRGEAAYRQRVEDVTAIYTGSTADQRRLLSAYEVEYVYVGPNERARYDDITVTDHPALRETYSAGAVTIYAVDQEQL